MNAKLRYATPQDMPSIHNLICDLAEYENEPHEVTVSIDELIHDGFTLNLFKVIVAEINNEIVGMALFYPRYSTWKGRTIHLEDFIVKESFRKSGIGLQLFEAVVQESLNFNAKRLEWMVLGWNMPAINFYQKVEAEFDREWEIGKLREEQLKNYKFKSSSTKVE